MLQVRSPIGAHRPFGSAWRRRLVLVIAAGLAVLLAPAAAAAATPSHSGKTARPVAVPRHQAVAGQPDLGPNVYVFSPDMDQSYIQSTVDAISTLQVSNQFGPQRYALLFEPGTYGSVVDPLIFQVGYYTEVAGLGQSPGDVVVNGSIDVYNQCFATTDGTSNCIALDNFWRSLSNLTINVAGGSGCQTNTEFWAVSQAAPMRRVQVNGGFSLMDYCSAGPQYASGGFIADSAFTGGTIVNGSQQQFVVRNSNLDGWTNGVWNQVFSGDPGAPAQSFSATSGLAGGTAPVHDAGDQPGHAGGAVPLHGLERRQPGLRAFRADEFRRPDLVRGHPTPGTSVPLSKFYIAEPGTSAYTINRQLARGLNLLLTPGVYKLAGPITVVAQGHDRARPRVRHPGPAARDRGHERDRYDRRQDLGADLRRRAEELAGAAAHDAGRGDSGRASEPDPGRVLPDRRGDGGKRQDQPDRRKLEHDPR